ncbi:Variant-specific surface protein [Giardia duodenalis]|uniref:Variant-specific surface protein n=1 Tax=Giardia intestinalis TaxID=5741 RepID=V6TUS3_GIAIN|nr:Variant-specific surface protein [Giardia intestinalis]
MLNTFTLASLLAQLFLAALSSEETCTTGTGSTKCAENMCNVWIGGQKYCSQCAEAGEAPIDGICKSDKAGNTCDNKVCTSCVAGYFFYMGGCYKKGQAPGNAICTDTEAGAVGVCTTCAAGYFKNPATVAAGTPPCIACNDTTGNSGNKGIDKCSTCTIESSPNTGQTAKCTKCIAPNYLKVTSSTTQCVATANDCGDGYAAKQDTDNGNQCVSCEDTTKGVTGCARCTYDSANARIQCTKCTTNYLKKKADGSTECVAENQCDVSGSAYYKVSDATKGNKCVSCSDAAGITDAAGETWKGVEGCAKCTKPADINTATACDECSSGYTLEGGKCTSSSANRSGLSTGAIAGISVAAVVVVGGLVSFLCWWFVCRGKA